MWRGEDIDLAERLTLFRRDYPYRDITVRGTPWRYQLHGVSDCPTVFAPPWSINMVPDPFFLVIEAPGSCTVCLAQVYEILRIHPLIG